MFDISWGQLAAVTTLGFYLIGKNDLPKAAHTFGLFTGRLVGLLQGTRMKADTFVQASELKQLQNELKLNLRELDMVKSELLMTISPGGMNNNRNTLGPLTSNANNSTNNFIYNNYMPQRQQLISSSSSNNSYNDANRSPLMVATTPTISDSKQQNVAVNQQQQQLQLPTFNTTTTTTSALAAASTSTSTTSMVQQQQLQQSAVIQSGRQYLAPSRQSMAAVAEEIWMNKGIAFVSKGEQQYKTKGNAPTQQNQQQQQQRDVGGSILLANMIHQSLIFDQYERYAHEHDDALKNRMNQTIEKINLKKEKEKELNNGTNISSEVVKE